MLKKLKIKVDDCRIKIPYSYYEITENEYDVKMTFYMNNSENVMAYISMYESNIEGQRHLKKKLQLLMEQFSSSNDKKLVLTIDRKRYYVYINFKSLKKSCTDEYIFGYKPAFTDYTTILANDYRRLIKK